MLRTGHFELSLFLSKEPFISAKKRYNSVKEPYISAKRALSLQKSPISVQISPTFHGRVKLQIKPGMCAIRVRVCAKKPYISAKEPYISTKKPYISTKEPYISTKEPYISTKYPCLLWISIYSRHVRDACAFCV